MLEYDVLIVGASFSGLTLAHHLPKDLHILVVEAKPEPGSTVESTGLITEKTREEFRSFFDVDRYITNSISSICVVAPNFQDFFISRVEQPWIYQTDTKALVKALATTLPSNVEVRAQTVFCGVDHPDKMRDVRLRTKGNETEEIRTRFLVGADGGRSSVAAVCGLDRNRRFLFGYEHVFFGRVLLGPNPSETIYHFWFGAFSLGYGGWLSPTVVDGRPAFRVGLAKVEKDRGGRKTF
ncbi:MAG TPA: FAD-dependent monooxygenase [Patescibacteria group bacterium]|nr:FAD-dependent monooxygenase [Patescibacteria group bacterium]